MILFCGPEAAMCRTPLDLLDGVQVERRARRVLADTDDGIADEGVGRHRQVERRRHAAEDAAREIVARAVAGAEISPLPARAEAAAGLRHEAGNAAEMRADAHQHEDLGLHRAMPVL